MLQLGLDDGTGLPRIARLNDVSGVREYRVGDKVRAAVGVGSARAALPVLGPSREMYFMANTRCFVRTGDASITSTTNTAHPLAADERFHIRVPVGHTHFAVIRDTADGFISAVPVA